MNKYLLLAALSAVSTAAPAFAQYSTPGGVYSPQTRYGAYSPQRLIDRLAARIDMSMRSGIISRFEGQRLRMEADRLRRLEYRFRLNGMTGWERSDLARRIDILRNSIFAAERGYRGTSGRDRTYDRDRFDDGDVFTDYDRNNDGWDDRDRDRDGRWDDDRPSYNDSRQSDDFDESARARFPSNVEDRMDYVNPADSDEGPAGAEHDELSVGDRAPADLEPVPSYLRNRYRDGGGLYYRYRDGTIFQIDGNTNVIRWMAEVPE